MKYLTITRKMLIKITATVVAVVAVFAVVLATPNAEQTSAGKKLLRGSSFLYVPVDDVIIKGNYVQIADFL